MRLMQTLLLLFCLTGSSLSSWAQYAFSGEVTSQTWEGELYLSLVDNYRKLSGIHPEQIINKTIADSSGRFLFTGDNLHPKNNIYRIHIDNCPDNTNSLQHFSGHCLNSEEILFIARNTDTLALPLGFDKELFCEVRSTNKKAAVFTRLDSLREVMAFEFSKTQSQANKQLNADKWIKSFQKFGQELDEPLAELYGYALFSDRSSQLFSFYLNDLEDNAYYQALEQRLEQQYPNHPFTQQYRNELLADRFLLSQTKPKSRLWIWLIAFLLLSVLINGYLIYKRKNRNATPVPIASLTAQEEKIVQLILQNHTNKEIATSIFVSLSTVKSHINNIYRKLGVSSRTQLKDLFSK
ncbi:MAG: helix-turn-helix transcriptional regulator [Dokdonia sp.]|jgi:DNA-binding CsgD family transcriptional regulator